MLSSCTFPFIDFIYSSYSKVFVSGLSVNRNTANTRYTCRLFQLFKQYLTGRHHINQEL